MRASVTDSEATSQFVKVVFPIQHVPKPGPWPVAAAAVQSSTPPTVTVNLKLPECTFHGASDAVLQSFDCKHCQWRAVATGAWPQ